VTCHPTSDAKQRALLLRVGTGPDEDQRRSKAASEKTACSVVPSTF
jgi:hypothetical protein